MPELTNEQAERIMVALGWEGIAGFTCRRECEGNAMCYLASAFGRIAMQDFLQERFEVRLPKGYSEIVQLAWDEFEDGEDMRVSTQDFCGRPDAVLYALDQQAEGVSG